MSASDVAVEASRAKLRNTARQLKALGYTIAFVNKGEIAFNGRGTRRSFILTPELAMTEPFVFEMGIEILVSVFQEGTT